MLGAEHVETLASRDELARAYRDAGRYDEAIRLLKATLKMREQSLGHGHPTTVASRHTLAEVYLAANRDEEADALQKAD
jgi:thioredoxin-like negative regulator of GroEL